MTRAVARRRTPRANRATLNVNDRQATAPKRRAWGSQEARTAAAVAGDAGGLPSVEHVPRDRADIDTPVPGATINVHFCDSVLPKARWSRAGPRLSVFCPRTWLREVRAGARPRSGRAG